MNLNIEIDEKRIAQIVEETIAKDITDTYGYEAREARHGVRSGVDKAVKEYIYKNKDRIIDRVVERATVEMVKKGLPKLIENLGKE